MTAIKNGYDKYFLPELKTPLQLGLQPGDKVRSYPPDLTFWGCVKIADISVPGKKILDLKAVYQSPPHYMVQYRRASTYPAKRCMPARAACLERGFTSQKSLRDVRGSQLLGLAAGAKLSTFPPPPPSPS